VYRLALNITTLNTTNHTVPTYLTQDVYYTGITTFNITRYFYIPVTRNTGDMVIFLNKTGALGQNGDSLIVTKFISSADSLTL